MHLGHKSAAAAVVAATTALLAPLAAAKPPAGTAFLPGVQLLAPPGSIYGITQAEPSIKVGKDGSMYVAAPAANGFGCEFWTVDSTDLTSQRFTTPPDSGVGGGDCDLGLSPDVPAGQTQQTISYSSLYAANLVAAKSTDGGATFTNPPNFIASTIPGNDRQWLAAAEGDVVYMSYHIVLTNNIQVAKSTDGGVTFALANPVPAPGSGQAIDQAHIAQALYNNELGPIVVDEWSHAVPKPVFTIFTAPDNALENTGSGDGSTKTLNHDVFLASSYDGGMTWVDTPIWVGPIERTYDHIFPALAIDNGGGIWAAWISDEEHVYVTHSPAPAYGAPGSWTTPLRVDYTGSNSNIYPWLVGGGSGYADLVWYAGTSNDPALLNNDTANTWQVRAAQLQWRATSGVAVKSNVVASDHVIHTGAMCTTGVTCNPTDNSRLLLDFFQVALTPDGRMAIAWADDHATPGAQIYVTVQCSGTNSKNGRALPDTC